MHCCTHSWWYSPAGSLWTADFPRWYRCCCSQSSPRWFLPIPWSRSGYFPCYRGSGCLSRSYSSRISDCDLHRNRRYRSRFLPSPAPSGSRFHICSSLPPSPWTSPTPAFPLCRTSWSAPLLGSGTGCQNTPHSRSVHKRRSHGCSSLGFQHRNCTMFTDVVRENLHKI